MHHKLRLDVDMLVSKQFMILQFGHKKKTRL